jgi:hypothetical protein
MRRTVRTLIGNGFLAVSGKVPLAVAYTVEVFVPSVKLQDGSVVDERESAAGRVISMEPRDLSGYIGDYATLTLDDGTTWDCIVLDHNGRLEHRGEGPVPGGS